jgi:exonuclease I
LGLACAPTVRFANKQKTQKTIAKKPPASSESEESDDSSDSASSSSEQEATEKSDSELKDGFKNDDDKDDDLFVKKTEPVQLEESDEQLSILTDTEKLNIQVIMQSFHFTEVFLILHSCL